MTELFEELEGQLTIYDALRDKTKEEPDGAVTQ